MSYTKQTWVTGDTITAEKLNHIEDGIDGISDILIVNVDYTGSANVLDKTYTEIKNALLSGQNIIICYEDVDEDEQYGYERRTYYPIVYLEENIVQSEGGTYYSVYFTNGTYQASSPDGVLTLSD